MVVERFRVAGALGFYSRLEHDPRKNVSGFARE
jgi:hypothetical protein